MTLTFEEVRDWAIDRATDWALEPDGGDRLAIGDLRPAWPLRIEAFNLLVPVAAAAAGRPSDLEGTGVRSVLKRRGADRAARHVGVTGLAQLARHRGHAPTRGIGQTTVTFLSELATPSSLEPMLAVAAALPNHRFSVVSADPRASRAWSRASVAPLPLVDDWRGAIRTRGQTVAAARRRWESIVARPPTFEILGRDVGGDALARLEPLVRRSIPWLAIERQALARRLDRLRPAWLVLASDQHRLGRLAVDLARERGIRTLVLQHGLPQYRLGFLPVVADEVATWSTESDAWLIERGAPPERLIRLGNPRLDALVRSDRGAMAEAVASEHGLSGRPRLLLALSPNDLERNLALLGLALSWLAREADARLIVKLHPGDGRWDAVRARIAKDPASGRVVLARAEPLYPLLQWADLVLLHRSSVAVEALAGGTPVAIGVVDSATDDDALPADLFLPEVADIASLDAFMTDVTTDGGRMRFFEDRRDPLDRTTGLRDGHVAERIAAHLLDTRVD